MDQERFDQLAREISSASTRRKMLGGVVAGLFGAGVAKLGGVAAKPAKTKHKKVKTHKGSTKSKKDGTVHKEQAILCASLNDAVNCPNGCCSPQAGGVILCLQNGRGQCGVRGGLCQPLGECQCCDPNTGAVVTPPAADPTIGRVGTCGVKNTLNPSACPGYPPGVANNTGGVCQVCPGGCCANPAIGEFGTQCKANGSGNCGLNGVVCNTGTGCNAGVGPGLPGNSTTECCTSTGNCANGANPGTVANCGSGRNLCKTCTGTNATCISGTCQAAPLCPGNQTDCSGTCIDLSNNTANCGKCGNACPACTGGVATCSGGTCGCTTTPKCPVGLTECGTACADLGSNPSNCGACGNVCPDCGKGKSVLCNGGACGCSQKKKKKKKNHHHHHHH